MVVYNTSVYQKCNDATGNRPFTKERTTTLSQQTGNQYQGPNGAPQPDHGQKIANIVRDSLQSGDLSRLKNLGPAVQDVVSDSMRAVGDGLHNIHIETRNQNNVPGPRQGQTGPYDPRQDQRPQRPAGPSYTRSAPGYQRMSYPRTRTQTAPMPRSAAYLTGNSGLRVPKGIVRIVLGIIGMVTFGLCTLAFGIAGGVGMPVFAPIAGACALAFAGSTVVTSSGFGTNKLAKQAQKYYSLFEKKKVYTLEEMAALTGRAPKKIKKDIRKMKGRGWLLDLIYDEGETSLMKGDDTYQQYLESRDHAAQVQQEAAERQRRMQDPEMAPMEAFRAEGVATIRKIRSANDAIPGEEISAKLNVLESNCARIFSYVEENPDKLPDTQKFMNYYLPTTLKLVEKYRQYEEMEYQPANVLEAKKQIEDALETINLAYKNLLEGFYQPDTLDVSTDIVVLQRMLEQEGLVGGNQFNIGDAPPAPQDSSEIKLTMDGKQQNR